MEFSYTQILLFLLATFTFLFFGGFAVTSLKEKEQRAALITSIFTLVLTTLFILGTFADQPIQIGVLGVSAGIALLFLIACLLPIGKVPLKYEVPSERFDERDTTFARMDLEPGSNRLASYYKDHPELLKIDSTWRSNPGLLSPDSFFANPFTFAIADASFSVIASLRKAARSPVSGEKVPLDHTRITSSIKSLARYLGALDVGICLLRPEFTYSHEGRDPDTYGEPIDLKHKYAIAMTFEMDHDLMRSSPRSPVVMESAHQYLEGAHTSLQLAAAIRNMGYDASAHYDGNYQVICPPIAREAGLGEIGRISILMTPNQGPRVRLAIVTTDLPLEPDYPKPDPSVIDFCSICKKCATNCPAKAISYNKPEPYKCVDLWRINADACYTYWTQCGTDCGRCMTVCPYSHPRSFYHDLIRWGIRHSGFFRRAALFMDNLFYGKNPSPHPAPKWTKPELKAKEL